MPVFSNSWYSGEWLDFAQGANWFNTSQVRSVLLDENVEFHWGPMVSEMVLEFNPDDPDVSTPPELIKLGEVIQSYFTASPTSGIASLHVDFTNLSTGDYDSCMWDFGDGNNSTECDNPIHTYDSPGTYTVSLTVSGDGSEDTETKTDYITVNAPDTTHYIFLPLLQK